MISNNGYTSGIYSKKESRFILECQSSRSNYCAICNNFLFWPDRYYNKNLERFTCQQHRECTEILNNNTENK